MELNPNCSEAVFRFYTIEPRDIQKILQLIADEIASNTDFEPHQGQQIPLFETAEQYDTNFSGQPSYSSLVYKRAEKKINEIWKKRDSGEITQEQAVEQYSKIMEKVSKKVYPNTLLKACAGLGDNEAIITIESDKGAFRLNIGNNDISENTTGWIEKIEAMNIRVEEAETSEELQELARDCTCGIRFFPSDARQEQQDNIRKLEEKLQKDSRQKVNTNSKLGE